MPEIIDIQNIKKTINEYKECFNKLSAIFDVQQKILNFIDIKAANIKSYFAEQELRKFKVETLNANANHYRINILKKAGFHNYLNLYRAGYNGIANINGIGAKSALEIYDKVKDVYKYLYNEISIKTSYDDQDNVSSYFLRGIYIYKEFQKILEESKNIYKQRDKIKYLSDNARCYKGTIKWFFLTKKRKEEVLSSINSLNEKENKNVIILTKKIIDNLNEILNADTNIVWEDFKNNNIQYFNIIEKIQPGLLRVGSQFNYDLPKSVTKEVEKLDCDFKGLKCTLRKYQEFGVKYILHQKNVLLGDEMGLGKTVEAIAAMVHLRNKGATHFVVICPASVVINWCREIQKHSDLVAHKVHGKPNERNESFTKWMNDGGVAVTTYESTRNINLPSDFKYEMVVLDEAHFIKNKRAIRTRNSKRLINYATSVLMMTGTALENNVDEMVELIKISQPSIALTLETNKSLILNPAKFRQTISSVYLRRKREDVLSELPEKEETIEWCTLNEDERQVYENCLINGQYALARRLSWTSPNIENSCKLIRLKEIVKEAFDANRKVLIFSYFLETLNVVHSYFKENAVDIINGSVSPSKRQSILDEFEKSNDKNILICQITSGGIGLNIQSASVVVICEPQFKPSIENQAISRAYRMGQVRNVLVYHLLCEDSIDERLNNVLILKQATFDAYADKSIVAENLLNIDEKIFSDILQDEIKHIGEQKRENLSTSNEDNSKYYKDLIEMDYEELVSFLLSKYGPAKCNYFSNEDCKSKPKELSRTKEGLICHHIDEDKAIMLSDHDHAIKNPFEYQKASRLVYANILEHLLLHLKIAQSSKNVNSNEMVGIGGAVNFIIPQLNQLFSDKPIVQEYLANEFYLVKNDFESYILILKEVIKFIENHDVLNKLISKDKLALDLGKEINPKVLERI